MKMTFGKKIFAKDMLDKGPLPQIYRELLKLNNKQTKDLNRYFSKDEIEMAN